MLKQLRVRGLWPVLTLLEPALWPQSVPLLAECERLPARCLSGEVVSLGCSSTTSLFCESFLVSATVLQVLLIFCGSGNANRVSTTALWSRYKVLGLFIFFRLQ